MSRKLYGSNEIKKLVFHYIDKGGNYNEIEQGCLGWGKLVLFGDGLKTTIVEEVYINSQSSGHTVRMYDKCPKKYLTYLA